MLNIFIEEGKILLTSDIYEIEKTLKIKLSPIFKSFYLQHNGGIPKKIFYVPLNGKWEAFDIKEFYPLKYPLYKKGEIIEEAYNFYVNEKKLLPKYLIPFAENNTGDPYCVDIRSDNIYFFAIDDYNNLNEALILVSSDIKLLSAGLISEEEFFG